MTDRETVLDFAHQALAFVAAAAAARPALLRLAGDHGEDGPPKGTLDHAADRLCSGLEGLDLVGLEADAKTLIDAIRTIGRCLDAVEEKTTQRSP